MLTFTNEKHHGTCFYLFGEGNKNQNNEVSHTSLISSNNSGRSSIEASGNSSTESCGSLAYGFSVDSSYGSTISSVFSDGGSSSFSGGDSSGGSVSCGGSCCLSC